MPLDTNEIRENISENCSILIFDKTFYDIYHKRRYAPEMIFREYNIPKVFVRGHVPDGSYHPNVGLIEDISWIRKNCPEVYVIAFKSSSSKIKIDRHVHSFIIRGPGLEKELAAEIIKGLVLV